MTEDILITPPTAEPVSVDDMLVQLGMSPITGDDQAGNLIQAQLQSAVSAATRAIEDYTRTVLLTQTWLHTMDSFPGRDCRYSHSDHPHKILLPKLPFQSLDFFQYVDETGTLQQLTQDTSYGSDPSFPLYGYQLPSVGEGQPARLLPPWARPWPPTRRVPQAVQLQFKCGYGGPVTASMTEGSAILTGPTNFTAGDIGQLVRVPEAGTDGADLFTTILSVSSGIATLATDAAAAITSRPNNIWVGRPVPNPLLQGILLLAQFLYTQGGELDQVMPRAIAALVDPYRNLVA